MKENQTIQIEQLRQFYSLPKDQRKEEYKFMKPMMHDKLFLRTGLDHMTFEIVWINLNMEKDADYQDMKRDFEQAVALIKAEAK